MAPYSYTDTSGATRNFDAVSPEVAQTSAPNIDQHSGVQLVQSSTATQPTQGSTIPVASITGTTPTPATVTQPQPSTGLAGLQGTINAGQDAFTQGLAQNTADAQAKVAPVKDAFYQALLGQTTTGQATNDAYAGTVDPAQAALKDINNQILSEQVSARHQIESLQNNPQGLYGQGLQDKIDQINRQSISKQADLSVIQLAKQGQYDSAKAIADRAVAALVEGQKNKIEALKTMYLDNKDTFTKAEDRQFQVMIKDKETKAANEEYRLRAKFDQTIKQNDPLYRAQLANTYANTKKTLSELNNAPGAGYNGEFGATISLAANTGGTNQQRSAIASTLKQFIAQKDYPSAYASIQQATASALTGTDRTKFENAATDALILKNLQQKLAAYKAAGGDMNLAKSAALNTGKSLGVLASDKPYAALATELDSAFQVYRQNMTGAAFGANESRDYQKVRPSSSGSFDLNDAVIQGASNYANNYVDGVITTKVGKGGVYIKQYAEGATPQATQAPTGVTVQDPNGVIHTFPSIVEANKFKVLAGIK